VLLTAESDRLLLTAGCWLLAAGYNTDMNLNLRMFYKHDKVE
jgi:hypothetical protein